MATVNELYSFFEGAIPSELACEWDNDGRMVISSPEKQVKKVLVCLDISEDAVDYAVNNGFDCIVSHHPIIFKPIKNIDSEDHLGRKLCKLIKNDVSAFSFHTRLDKVSGGVNDALADAIGLKNISDFSDVGRMGETEESSLAQFAEKVKQKIYADKLICVDGGRPVKKIALVGGSGKEYLKEALLCGCDTFVTGEMPYNCEHDAREMGINLLCGGHYFTEDLVCERLEMLIKNFDGDIYTEKFDSVPSFVI